MMNADKISKEKAQEIVFTGYILIKNLPEQAGEGLGLRLVQQERR